MDIALCFVTCPSREVAQALAKQLVEEYLAACVNILTGVQSVYRWQESITVAEEALLIIKTNSARIEQLKKAILDSHPYETPEFVAIEANHVEQSYADWLASSLTPIDNLK